jgi:hypothetical protein
MPSILNTINSTLSEAFTSDNPSQNLALRAALTGNTLGQKEAQEKLSAENLRGLLYE